MERGGVPAELLGLPQKHLPLWDVHKMVVLGRKGAFGFACPTPVRCHSHSRGCGTVVVGLRNMGLDGILFLPTMSPPRHQLPWLQTDKICPLNFLLPAA